MLKKLPRSLLEFQLMFPNEDAYSACRRKISQISQS